MRSKMAHSYHLQALPSLKALLHAKKYPHSTVIGLLVGSVEAGKVLISDAIPLVHHWIDLSPMLEAGLALAEIHVKSKKLSLVGTYIAHSRADLNTLDLVSKRLNEALQFSGSIALVIDNQKLRTTENPFIPYSREGTSEWNCLENSRFIAELPARWYSLQTEIGDFDDHLEDVGVDWLINPGVHQTN